MKKRNILFILFFLVMDLVTKAWAELVLTIGENRESLIPYLSWQLLYNKGLSFSLLEGHPLLVLVLNSVAIIVVVSVLIKYMNRSMMWFFASALMIAGGTGNFVNRLLLGHVIDFISVKGYPAIFNIADIEIRLGMVLAIVLIVKEYVTKKQNTPL
jgi:signal peptidase II